MKRALVFCARDWRSPNAGWIERYGHQVFSRLAQRGYRISWVCEEQFGRLLGGDSKRNVDTVDGIQVARLGLPMFHGPMSRLLLSRLANTNRLRDQYDVIIDCVDGKPMRVPENADIPVAPLVFRLDARTPISDDPPSPFLAVTERVRRQLAEAGAGEEDIVYAPYGVDAEQYAPPRARHDGLVLAAVDDRPRTLLRALAHSSMRPFPLHAVLVSRKKPWSLPPGFQRRSALTKYDRAELFQHSTVGFCGEGREHEALAMAACGLPVIAPATMEGEEYVKDNVTGLLYEPRNNVSLRERLTAVFEDAELRERLAVRAREGIRIQTWDKTTDRIQAVLERL